jgi:pyruvate/2-oxoacid:ferredoxin oxidoreductase beta subunit
MEALILFLAFLIIFFKLFLADQNNSRQGSLTLTGNKNQPASALLQVFYSKDTVAGKQRAATSVISTSAREDRFSVYSRSPYFFQQITQDQNNVAA